jgi:hypothetical protein
MSVAEWSEVAIASFPFTPHDRCSWPFVAQSDGKKGVRLIVSESDVKSWLMPLNQAVFQHERIDFRRYLNPFDRRCCLQHLCGPRMEVADVLEIAVQPVT